jgi:hypothetical protein
MRSDIKNLCGIIALFLSIIPLTAQESEQGHKGMFRTLGCRVTVEQLFYAAVPEDGATRQDSSKEGSVGIFDSSRSNYYNRPGPGKVVFYRKTVSPDGKPIRKIVAEADLSKGGNLPLILFLPHPDRPEILMPLVLPDDPQSFPDTTCRFINLTPASLAATLGKSAATIAPAGVELFKTGIGEKAETRFATIALENARRLYSNNWVIRPGQRTMVIIYPVNGTTEVHRITDTSNL